MKQTNNILTFYGDDTSRFELNSEFNTKFDLVSPTTMLPFQLTFSSNVNLSLAINVIDAATGNINTAQTTKLVAMFTELGLSLNGEVVTYNGTNYRMFNFKGVASNSANLLSDGRYYLSVYSSATNDYFYSETFTICSSYANALKIEYYEQNSLTFDCGNGIISYANSYKSKAYINTRLGMPSFPIEEEIQKRDGVQYRVKQVSYKQYKFDFVCPQFMADSLRIIGMHDNVSITYKGETIICDSFNVDIKPSDIHEMYVVEAEFTTGTVVKKNARLI